MNPEEKPKDEKPPQENGSGVGDNSSHGVGTGTGSNVGESDGTAVGGSPHAPNK